MSAPTNNVDPIVRVLLLINDNLSEINASLRSVAEAVDTIDGCNVQGIEEQLANLKETVEEVGFASPEAPPRRRRLV